MHPSHRLFALALGLAVATPAGAQSATNDTLANSMLKMVMDPSRWHVSAQGGSSNFGNFLLQQTPGGARAVRGARAFTYGAGGGFDLDQNSSLRLGYMHTGTSMQYRDWSGTGSNLLNVSNIGDLSNNTLSLEADHYFVGSRSRLSPYAGFGFAGVWSHLSPNTALLATPGGAQKFGIGATANLGAQIRLTQEFFTRVEWATLGTPNPFNGNRSFQAPGGLTYDQPSRVTKQEWRVAAVYYLGKPASTQQPTVATSP